MAQYKDYMQDYIDSGNWESIRENITACGLFHLITAFDRPVRGIEIGIKEGMNSIAFLEMCPNIEKLVGIDPFAPYVDLGYHWTEEEQESIYQHMLKNVKMRNCDDRFEHIRTPGLDAVDQFEDDSIDFVFVDGEHTAEVVKAELTAYWPKLKSGGIMSGHDFDKIGHAVRAWREANDIESPLEHIAHTSWYFIKN